MGLAMGLLGLGGGLLGGIFNRRQKPDPYAQALAQSQVRSQQMGQGAFGSLMPQAQGFLQEGRSAMGPATSYWSNILAGNRAAATEALQPEISNISQGYNTALQTSAALMPRSGGASAARADLPFREAQDITTTLNQARPAAAQSLFGAGATEAGIGQGLAGTAIGGLQAGTSAAGTALDFAARQRQFDLMQRQQNIGMGLDMGKGLFSLLQKYGFGGILGKLGIGQGKYLNPSSLPASPDGGR